MPTNWTPSQLQAISAKNRDILVSAAAGSGKTTVMIERIMRLLRAGGSLQRMLIVTFTRAAASEMRERLTNALIKEAQEDEHLAQELDNIGRAHISTLHVFCADLIRRYFQEAEIDPNFSIKDEAVLLPLKEDALDDALEQFYLSKDSDDLALMEQLDDETLAKCVHQLYQFLMAQAEPFEWLRHILTAPENGQALMDAKLYAAVLDRAKLYLEGALQCAHTMESLALRADGPGRYMNNVNGDKAALLYLMEYIEKKRLFVPEAPIKFQPLSRAKAQESEDPDVVAQFKAMREKMKRFVGEAAELLPKSMEEADRWAQNIALTLPALRAMAKLTQAFYTNYAAAKRQANYADYHDLEHLALKALAVPAVRAAVQSQFDALFIDEYQDVSRTQEAIITAIHKKNHLFMVGDLKQSIYRFRLADPTLFMEKYNALLSPIFQDKRLVLLSDNFRSRKNILFAVNEVFQGAMRKRVTELDYTKNEALNPGRLSENDPPVELHLTDKRQTAEEAPDPDEADLSDIPENEEDNGEEDAQGETAIQHEAVLVARRILAIKEEQPELTNRDFVVLLRSAQNKAADMAAILKEHGIRVYNDADSQYWELPEVMQMMALLEVILNPRSDVALIAALQCPAFGFTEEELAQIRLTGGKQAAFYDALISRQESDSRVAAFLNKIKTWRFLSRHLSFEAFLRQLLHETELYERAAVLLGAKERQANLRLMLDKAAETSPEWTLAQFVAHVKKIQKTQKEGAATLSEQDDVVRIMTIHKSKGLEFPVVFVCGLASSFRLNDRENLLHLHPEAGVAMPHILKKQNAKLITHHTRGIRLIKETEIRAEEARLLYVAMTRAKERLILTATPRSIKSSLSQWRTPPGDLAAGTATSMMDWIGNALQQAILPGEDRDYISPVHAHWRIFWHPVQTLAFQKQAAPTAFTLPPLPPVSDRFREKMRLPEQEKVMLKTSVTALLKKAHTIEEETEETKRQALDTLFRVTLSPCRLPELIEDSSPAAYGSLMHKALSLIDLKALAPLKPAHYEQELSRQIDMMTEQGIFLPREKERVRIPALSRFYQSPPGQRLLKAETVRREWPFTYRLPQGTLMQGVMDLCFFEPDGWVLVDYKTDRDVKALLPVYAEQLRMYARALQALTGQPVREALLFALSDGDIHPIDLTGDFAL